MKTEEIAEKAREYSNKINRLSPEHSDNTICPITPKELKRYTINDFISGAEWMNQQWQEKVRWIPVEERLPIAYETGLWDGKRSDFVIGRDNKGTWYKLRIYETFMDGSHKIEWCEEDDSVQLNIIAWREII